MTTEIQFEIVGRLGLITLDRPKALNALTLEQIRLMEPKLREWAGNSAIKAVAIRATGGKAFSAGGDIRAIYDARQREDFPYLEAFYREEYALNRLIKTYPKPYVALIDGIVMGGGVGVSIHGSQRVATEKTLFAMPETGIGLFPDVGGTYFLPRCPGALGMYLGLTGARLGAADSLYCGIATHFAPSQAMADLVGRLASIGSAKDVEGILGAAGGSPGAAPLEAHRAAIDRCFAKGSVEEILAALKAEGEWGAAQIETLHKKSPLSLKITFEQLTRGKGLDFDAAMKMEFRLSQRFVRGFDFFEGVRAVIVDKDQNPRWQPASLDRVQAAEVEAYFAPHERELTF